LSGKIGLGFNCCTYNGKIVFGICADKNVVPDPSEFLQILETEIKSFSY
jgi:hypothetical protein